MSVAAPRDRCVSRSRITGIFFFLPISIARVIYPVNLAIFGPMLLQFQRRSFMPYMIVTIVGRFLDPSRGTISMPVMAESELLPPDPPLMTLIPASGYSVSSTHRM